MITSLQPQSDIQAACKQPLHLSSTWTIKIKIPLAYNAGYCLSQGNMCPCGINCQGNTSRGLSLQHSPRATSLLALLLVFRFRIRI
jgi:hypothetical protein